MAYLTLNEAKKQLNVDLDFLDDDTYISELIETAEISLSYRINDDLLNHVTAGKLVLPLKRGIYFLVSQWYEHREPVSNINVYKVPFTLDDIIQDYINHTIK